MLPIVYEGAIEFLKSRRLVDAMPYMICYSDIEGLVDLLYKDNDWTERVFAIKTVSKYNVAAFFFQLIATKILSFEWVGTTKLVCVISRVGTSTVFNYEKITFWEGFEFRTKAIGKRMIKYEVLLQTYKNSTVNTAPYAINTI